MAVTPLISPLEMASKGNRHCANCIGTLSFPVEPIRGFKGYNFYKTPQAR